MFYDRFKELCDAKGVSCNKAAVQIGLSNATPTTWKKRGLTPKGDTLSKIADYFGVTTDYLLTGEQKESVVTSDKTATPATPDGIKAAFWGGDKDLSAEDLDAMWADVKKFADFIAQQKRQEKTKND